MDIISLYNDFLDRTETEQNGSVTIEKFNRFERLAELRFLDFLSGDVEGVKPPEPYSNTKLRDWLSIFIKKDSFLVQDGYFTKPSDYYRYDRNAVIGDYRDEVCGKDVLVSNGNTPIEILDGQQFDYLFLVQLKILNN